MSKTGNTVVRNSKYRHIFGTQFQLRDCHGDVRLGVTSQESNPIIGNAELFAVTWQIPGSILINPLDRKGAVPEEGPLILNDTEGEPTINDIKFAPHDDHLIGGACQDNSARLWRIPAGGLTENITQAEVTLTGHAKRLLLIEFHPYAATAVLTSGADNDIKLWDVNRPDQPASQLNGYHKGLVTSLSWNGDATFFATSSKDKNLRLFDPRIENPLVGETASHPGAKSGKLTFLGNRKQILTVGFSKTSEREIVVHDVRNLNNKLTTQKLDSSPSTPLPIYDDDNGILYLAGKGDGNIRSFEIVDGDPYVYHVNEFKSKEPATGFTKLPKSVCNLMKCEIARFLKLTPQGQVIPIRYECPRQNMDFFHDDLFPDTWDRKPVQSATEWFHGDTKKPNLVSLKP